MSKNTEGAGGAMAKTGDQATPLSRGMGMSKTAEAMDSKVRSPHNAAGGPGYAYKDAPKGPGDGCCTDGYSG